MRFGIVKTDYMALFMDGCRLFDDEEVSDPSIVQDKVLMLLDKRKDKRWPKQKKECTPYIGKCCSKQVLLYCVEMYTVEIVLGGRSFEPLSYWLPFTLRVE